MLAWTPERARIAPVTERPILVAPDGGRREELEGEVEWNDSSLAERLFVHGALQFTMTRPRLDGLVDCVPFEVLLDAATTPLLSAETWQRLDVSQGLRELVQARPSRSPEIGVSERRLRIASAGVCFADSVTEERDRGALEARIASLPAFETIGTADHAALSNMTMKRWASDPRVVFLHDPPVELVATERLYRFDERVWCVDSRGDEVRVRLNEHGDLPRLEIEDGRIELVLSDEAP